MSHYFDKNVTVKSNRSFFDFTYRNNKFKFYTDNGVFSKKYIDFGSYTLIDNYKPRKNSLNVLDMCCGYGVIGIVLNKLYGLNLYLTDINERAIDLAKDNSLINQVETKIYCGNLYEALPSMLFDDILVNPPIRTGKDNVFNIYKGAYERLVVGGMLYVVIQKKQGAPSSIKFLTELFGNCDIIAKEKGYYVLRMTKNLN